LVISLGFIAQAITLCMVWALLYYHLAIWNDTLFSVSLWFSTRMHLSHCICVRIVITNRSKKGTIWQTISCWKVSYIRSSTPKIFSWYRSRKSKDGLVISQGKDAFDILEETGMISKPMEMPMDPSVKFALSKLEPYSNPRRYKRLVGKLNYLFVTHPNFSLAMA